jgi:predicted metalloendopeptidase
MRNLPLAAATAALSLVLGARAEIDLKNFDLTVKTEDDFYHHVNGTWLKNNPIPADRSVWASYSEIDERNQTNLRSLCERVAAKTDGATPVEKMVGDFYASGMNEAVINALGAKPLQPELDRIAAVKTPADVLQAIAHLQSLGVACGFAFGSSPDLKQSDREIARLGQGGLGLPERGYYFNDDEKSRTIRSQYVAHIANLLVLAGESRESAIVSAQAVLALETKLAVNTLARVQLRDPYRSYHKMTVSEAAAKTPGIDFALVFAGRGAPKFDEINLAHPEFFQGFAVALNTVPVSDWQAYLRWHLVRHAAPYLSEAFVAEDFAFNGRILTGTTEQKPRWKRIVGVVDGEIGEALGQLYVADYFPPEAKVRMAKLVEDLRASLHDRINALEWMDAPTKAKAQAKLAAFGVKIGYPDQWRDYSSVKITRDDYYGNVVRADAFDVSRRLARIGQAVDRREWGMTPPTVNAYYRATNNEIVFPAGILQPPFFDFKADDAVNYGGIGAVIGHEMTHGFDDSGSKYDAHGNLNNWWTEESAKNFKARTTAIVKQFAAYEPLPGVHLNGELTQGENIADLGGVKIAYYALQKALADKPRDLINGFTPEQRFFLNYATIWRINSRPEAVRLRANTDPHSPGEFRANGPLSNLDEFAKAFNVTEGSPMRRPPEARVTIW